jgi:hypothetical protein
MVLYGYADVQHSIATRYLLDHSFQRSHMIPLFTLLRLTTSTNEERRESNSINDIIDILTYITIFVKLDVGLLGFGKR